MAKKSPPRLQRSLPLANPYAGIKALDTMHRDAAQPEQAQLSSAGYAGQGRRVFLDKCTPSLIGKGQYRLTESYGDPW